MPVFQAPEYVGGAQRSDGCGAHRRRLRVGNLLAGGSSLVHRRALGGLRVGLSWSLERLSLVPHGAALRRDVHLPRRAGDTGRAV